jgi:hypothetical protein
LRTRPFDVASDAGRRSHLGTPVIGKGDFMKPDIEPEGPASTIFSLDRVPKPLQLEVGSAVYALRGQIWLTQEGRIEDFILDAGQRFEVVSRDLILVSATRGAAQLYIAPPSTVSSGRRVCMTTTARAQCSCGMRRSHTCSSGRGNASPC